MALPSSNLSIVHMQHDRCHNSDDISFFESWIMHNRLQKNFITENSIFKCFKNPAWSAAYISCQIIRYAKPICSFLKLYILISLNSDQFLYRYRCLAKYGIQIPFSALFFLKEIIIPNAFLKLKFWFLKTNKFFTAMFF